jgi:Dynamin family
MTLSHTGASSLADMMMRGVEKAEAEADKSIGGLAEVAGRLDMRETEAKLTETARQLRSDTFNLMVMGRFKNGKSTLLNALLGGTTAPVDLGGQQGPMVVDDLPATATLTGVVYAEQPYIRVWSFDGTSQDWPLDRYLRESTLDVDQLESARRFQDIREFEMGFPARLCQAGVTIYDSPGLDEHDDRTKITQDAVQRCDAAVLVYRSDVLMGQNELMNATDLIKDGTRIFTVVNLMNARAADDRLKGFVWNRYVRDNQGGPAWDGQDAGSRDIYFVDAEHARQARYQGDEQLAADCGLAELERRLADFLLRERHHVHLKRYATQATNLTETIDQHIDQRIRAGRTDQARLAEAFQTMLPSLDALRGRPAKLPRLFSRYRTETESALAASFTAEVGRIRADLPGQLALADLGLSKVTGAFRQKQAVDQVAELISSFVRERLARWEQDEAQKLLRSILDRLNAEIEEEITAIGQEFGEIHLNLTGWEIAAGGKPMVGTTERVLSAAASILLGDVAGAVAGGYAGWRGAAGSVAGAIGAGFILGMLGLGLAAPIALPVLLAATFFGSATFVGHGLEKRVKDHGLAEADKMLSGLPAELNPKMAQQLGKSFAALETVVTREITAAITEEERNIREMVEANQRDQSDRDRMLASLEQSKTEVAGHLATLRRAVTIAQQG